MKKNDLITVRIDAIGNDGEGIGRADGYPLFIKDALPGDLAEVRITKAKKTYGYARLEKILEASPDRTTPQCALHRRCGGCQIQALSYEKQLSYKQQKVRENLIRIGGFSEPEVLPVLGMENPYHYGCQIQALSYEKQLSYKQQKVRENLIRIGGFSEPEVLPVLGMENPYHYRNKAQFPFGKDKEGRIVTGFYAGRTHTIVPGTDCAIGVRENKEILELILQFMNRHGIEPYNESTGKGLLRHVLIRKGFATGELMVCLVINGRSFPKAELLADALFKIPGMTSFSLNINRKNTNVILGEEVIPVRGKTYITDRIGDISYQISPLSFYQVNPAQTEKLYRTALDYAQLTGNERGKTYITDRIGDISYQISPLSFYQVNPAQTEKLYRTALDYAQLTGNEIVWELYCGIGTISLFLAQKAGKVFGVEIVPQAVEDARRKEPFPCSLPRRQARSSVWRLCPRL